MLSIVASEPPEDTALKVDLDALVREGARRMLVAALKAEVDEYIAQHADERDEAGHALVVRNGIGEPRKVTTAAGELEIQAPRVDVRRERRRFASAILPPWARRSPKVTSETGREERMKEPYGKGVASRPGPESYPVSREAGGGAMARARTRWVWSSEIVIVGSADVVKTGGKATLSASICETCWDLPESETPCMCGTTLRRNGRSLACPRAMAVGRIEKPIGIRR
jgi:hypothetical protein